MAFILFGQAGQLAIHRTGSCLDDNKLPLGEINIRAGTSSSRNQSFSEDPAAAGIGQLVRQYQNKIQQRPKSKTAQSNDF